MAIGSDVASYSASGAALGATLGSAVPVVGTVIGAGIGVVGGALAAVGKFLFGRRNARKAKEESEKLARDEAVRHKEMLSEATKRSEELYEKYKVDPQNVKQEYAQAVQKSLEQQSAQNYASLATQGGVNPAMAAQALSQQSARAQAEAAGTTALTQEKLGVEFDLYNKQLMQTLREKEIAVESEEGRRQYQIAEEALKQQQAIRAHTQDEIFGALGKGVEVGTTLAGLGGKKDKTNSPQTDAMVSQVFKQPQNPWDKYKLTDNPTNLYNPQAAL